MAKLEGMLLIRERNFIYDISWPKFKQNEVLSAVMQLLSRAMLDLGPYGDFRLPCMSKNDQCKDCQ